MRANGEGHLGVLARGEPGLGRGGLFPSRDYCTQLARPCASGEHWRALQDLEMSHHETAAEMQLLSMASHGDAVVEHGGNCWDVSRAFPSFQD